MNMLEKIEAQFAALSNAEQKVARQILTAPQAAMHSSIATLAREACVSENPR